MTWAVLGICLVLSGFVASRLAGHALARLAVTLVLTLALSTAVLSLPPGPLAGLVAVGAMAAGAFRLRAGRVDARLTLLACPALALLLAAAWLYPVGFGNLYPDRAFLVGTAPLVELARSGPTPALTPPDRAVQVRLLAALAGDPWKLNLTVTATAQMGVFLALFLTGWRRGNLAAFMGAALAFAGSTQAWLLTSDLAGALAHLWIATALMVRILAGHSFWAGPMWAGLGLGALAAAPEAAWALALGALLLDLLRRAYGWSVWPALVLGLALFTKSWPVGPSLPGFGSALLLVGLAYLAYRRRELDWGLWLGLELAAWLVAPTCRGLGLGAVLGQWLGRALAKAWTETRPAHPWLRWRGSLELSLPWRYLIALGVLLVLRYGVDAGETRFNQRLLIAAQKQGVNVLSLFVPPVAGRVEGAELSGLVARVVNVPLKSPSRSLVPVRLQLINPTPEVRDLTGLRGARLTAYHPRTRDVVSFKAPLESLGLAAVKLASGQSVEVDLWLSTPEPEGDCAIELSLEDERGGQVAVPIAPPLVVRTWGRVPPDDFLEKRRAATPDATRR